MRARGALPVRTGITVAAAAVAVLALVAGCTGGDTRDRTPAGSVAVAVVDPFTSANPDTSYGDTPTNRQVAAVTRSGFGYYDDRHRLVLDRSFGTAKVVSNDPFTVRYTVDPKARWSDGVPIDATDLLLSWAAESERQNDDLDVADYVDPATGRFTSAFPTDAVYFDGHDAALATSTGTPRIGDGGRSIEVRFAARFDGWQLALEPTLAAHAVADAALGPAAGATSSARKAAVRDAIRTRGGDLAAISRAWNDAGNLAAVPTGDSVLVASGPYRVKAIGRDGSVTLVANSRYRGSRTPGYRELSVRPIADPLAQAAALKKGEVQVAVPAPTVDAATALLDLSGVQVSQGAQDEFEHLDLKITGSRNGTFANPEVRRAFLHVVPRRQILQQLVQPVAGDAQPLRSFTLPPGDDDYAESARSNGSAAYQETDAGAASELLRSAGVASPEVCVLFDADDARRRAEFELIRTSAAAAGFRVTDCSSPKWRNELGTDGAYDAVLDSWRGSELGTAAIAAAYRSGTSADTTGFSYAGVDALVDSLAGQSPARQRATLVKIDALLWEEGYGAPLFQYPAISAASRTVRGVTLSPQTAGVFWDAWTWRPRG